MNHQLENKRVLITDGRRGVGVATISGGRNLHILRYRTTGDFSLPPSYPIN